MDKLKQLDGNFRWVPGFEDAYAVSDEGVVISFHRLKPKTLKLSCAGGQRAHLKFSARKHGTMKNYYVHRAVLEAFVGPCPPNHEACHIDGNPGNNRLENLI